MIDPRPCIFLVLIWFLTVTGYAQSTKSEDNVIRVTKGNSVALYAQSKNARGYEWYKDGIRIVGAIQKSYTVTSEGLYSVIAFNEEGCPSEISEIVHVLFTPVIADLEITKTSGRKDVIISEPYDYMINVKNNGAGDASNITVTDTLPPGLVVENLPPVQNGSAFYNFLSNSVTWKLDQLKNGESIDLRLTTKSLEPGLIENTAVVTYRDDPDLSNNRSTNRREIVGVWVPNVFTPNGDNINDLFVIENLDAYQENTLTLFNRTGNHVYEIKNYQNTWKGEGLDEGTYFYVLTLKTFLGRHQVLKGYVTLLRTKNE